MRTVTVIRGEGQEKDIISADNVKLDYDTNVLTFYQGDPVDQMSTAPMFKVVAEYNWSLIYGYFWQEALETTKEEESQEDKYRRLLKDGYSDTEARSMAYEEDEKSG